MTCEHQFCDVRNSVSNQYTLGETIGKGHFAVVKLARHIFTQRQVAVKVIDKTKLDVLSKAHLFQEVKCMKLVQHPNVVRLYDVIDTTYKLYLILELADGGDMYDYIMKHANGLNESLARRYFKQICRALKYCHEMYVCHRDLKPENLVFFEKLGIVKLTDFGFSNNFSPGTKLSTSCGSLAYSAPEILLCDPYDAAAVDIWSLGVILYMLVTGRAPFQEANDYETVMMILDCCYKIPSHISSECQNLIRRMIVLKPEKRATLDEVMSDIWYRQSEEDEDDDDDHQHETDLLRLLSSDDHEFILSHMIDGKISDRETIIQALNERNYNYITATYYLLADKILHEKLDNEKRKIKRPRRALQTHTDVLKEQNSIYTSSNLNFYFADFSVPSSRLDVLDEDFDNYSGKENLSPMLSTPRHSFDSSTEQTLSALVEDDEEVAAVQQRPTSTSIPVNPAQAMKIILEEDENPESSPIDITNAILLQSNKLLKLNKIIENGDEDNKSATFIENSTTASGVLRSKDLRSVVETKRRNFSRSYSSSDSEDNGSSFDMSRFTNQKRARSPTSCQESEPTINHRGRSLSNIEYISRENSSSIQQQMGVTNNSENMKRRSFSRASSVVSSNRLTPLQTNEDTNTDQSMTASSTFFNDRARSLSIEHRLANPSQISIGSRTSMRHSTPRESTVFTKADAPIVVRLLQQAQLQDATDATRVVSENHRSQLTSLHQENIQTPIIVEEDTSLPIVTLSNKNLKSASLTSVSNDAIKPDDIISTMEPVSISNGHISTKPQSVLSTLRYSLIKHQQERHKSKVKNYTDINVKHKNSSNRHKACCTIM